MGEEGESIFAMKPITYAPQNEGLGELNTLGTIFFNLKIISLISLIQIFKKSHFYYICLLDEEGESIFDMNHITYAPQNEGLAELNMLGTIISNLKTILLVQIFKKSDF